MSFLASCSSLSPPPAPRRQGRRKRRRNLSAVRQRLFTSPPPRYDFDEAQREAETYFLSGCVRSKYFNVIPKDIERCIVEDLEYLTEMWLLFFPASQPRCVEEDAYLLLMRECIEARMGELST